MIECIYEHYDNDEWGSWEDVFFKATVQQLNKYANNEKIVVDSSDNIEVREFTNGYEFLYTLLESVDTVNEKYPMFNSVGLFYDHDKKTWHIEYWDGRSTPDKTDVRLVVPITTNLVVPVRDCMLTKANEGYNIFIPTKKYEVWSEVASHTIYDNLTDMVYGLVELLVQNIESDNQNIAFVAMSDEDKEKFNETFGE